MLRLLHQLLFQAGFFVVREMYHDLPRRSGVVFRSGFSSQWPFGGYHTSFLFNSNHSSLSKSTHFCPSTLSSIISSENALVAPYRLRLVLVPVLFVIFVMVSKYSSLVSPFQKKRWGCYTSSSPSFLASPSAQGATCNPAVWYTAVEAVRIICAVVDVLPSVHSVHSCFPLSARIWQKEEVFRAWNLYVDVKLIKAKLAMNGCGLAMSFILPVSGRLPEVMSRSLHKPGKPCCHTSCPTNSHIIHAPTSTLCRSKVSRTSISKTPLNPQYPTPNPIVPHY